MRGNLYVSSWLSQWSSDDNTAAATTLRRICFGAEMFASIPIAVDAQAGVDALVIHGKPRQTVRP